MHQCSWLNPNDTGDPLTLKPKGNRHAGDTGA